MDMEFYGKVILVTGATGCVGKSLTRRLLKEGWTVRTLACNSAEVVRLAYEGAQTIMGDITGAASLRQAFQGSHFVFHLSGAEDSHAPAARGQLRPVHSARAAAEAALQAGVERFIYLSDSIVYGYGAAKDTDEASPMHRSGGPAVRERVQAENAVRKAIGRGLPAVIVQPTTIYGPYAAAWTLYPLQLARAKRLACPHRGRGLLQPIHLDDVVEGILAAALVGKPGQSYLLPGSEVVTCRQFFEYFARISGEENLPGAAEGLAASAGEWMAELAGKPPLFEPWQKRCLDMHATYNGGKAYYDLGFLPHLNLESGMRRTEEWLHRERRIVGRAVQVKPE